MLVRGNGGGGSGCVTFATLNTRNQKNFIFFLQKRLIFSTIDSLVRKCEKR